MKVAPGSTDVTTYFKLRNEDGTPATAITITDLDLQYTRSGASPTAKVDATALGAANSAHSDNTAFEIDATDQPGIYRVDWPDAAFASGVREVILTVKGPAGTLSEDMRVDLQADADTADAIWDEVLSIAAHNVAQSAGRRLRNLAALADVDSSINDAAATTTSFVTALTTAVDDFYNDQLIVFTSGTLAGQSRPIVDYDGTTKTITLDEPLTSAPANGVTFTIQSTHIHPIAQIQSGLATAAAVADLPTNAELTTALADLPTNAELATALAAADDAVLAAIAALENLSLSDVFDTVLTEAYAANGAAMNLREALYSIQQTIQMFAISGASKVVMSLDGVTPAFTITHNDATNPSAATRS